MSVCINDYILALDCNFPCYLPLLSTKSTVPLCSSDLLFSLSCSLELSPNTKYLAYHILNRLNFQNPIPVPFLYTALLIASKIYEITPLSISKIHSCINRTKTDLKALEKSILLYLDYRVLEYSLLDWVSSYLELCTSNLSSKCKAEIRKVTVYLIDFVYFEGNMIASVPVGVIAAGIINSSLVILTKYTGAFPYSSMLAKALHQEVELIVQVSNSVLNLALGDEFYSQFNF
jgi:Cyclin, N-terminal domain